MGRRANQSNSVLKRQKPKIRSQRKSFKWGFLGVLLVTLIASGAFLWHNPNTEVIAPNLLLKKAQNRQRKETDPWRIDIKNEGSESLDDNLVIKIRSTLQSELGAASIDFQHLSNLVRKIGSFTTVRIAQISGRHLVVQVTPRVPSLCIEADQIRFIDKDGTVYGSPNTLNECPGPPLKGVFDVSHKHTLNEDATLELTSAEQTIIKDALSLRNSLVSFELQPTSMHFTKHRGFTVTLKDKSPEITLGYPPFETRLDKLVSLLSKLASKGEEALRIELDYQGKAFLKLKKI
jgi:hypothetical protein